MRGGIVGLRGLVGAADIASGVAEAWPYLKGFNDQPEGQILGSAGGKLVARGMPDGGGLGGLGGLAGDVPPVVP
jgi:hypothetical protein